MGKHCIHIIEGGDYLTEDMESNFDENSKMGCFYLNQKEYDYFKNHLIDVEFVETETGLKAK